MDLPETLPGKLYLLAYDPERERLTGSLNLDMLMRAAALTDLLRRGLLRDDNGRPAVTGPAPAGLNPVLAQQLKLIAGPKARKWHSWIQRQNFAAHTVRDDLAAGGWIRLEEHRILGLFPATRVTPRDPRVRKALAATVSRTLRGPLSQVEPADAAIVALAEAARLRSAVSRQQHSEYRERLADLAALSGPAPKALRQAIRSRDAS